MGMGPNRWSDHVSQDVLDAIDSERAYQKKLWPGHEEPDNPLTIGEFLLLIEQYSSIAREEWTKEAKPELRTLEVFRKIAAIAVNCMEQHGALKRQA